jgi:hypothetical protein
MAAIPAVVRMQLTGFKLDVAAHDRLLTELTNERAQIRDVFFAACTEWGHPDLAHEAPTPAQKETLLKARLTVEELARWKRTPTGRLSTARAELRHAAHYKPVEALADLSRLDKLITAFDLGLSAHVSPVTGRIHGHYSVASQMAGRTGCSKPNVQQAPKKDAIPSSVRGGGRRCFSHRRLWHDGAARRRRYGSLQGDVEGFRRGPRPARAHRGKHAWSSLRRDDERREKKGEGKGEGRQLWRVVRDQRS